MLLFAAALIASPAAAAQVPDGTPIHRPNASNPSCPRTTSYYAWQRDKQVTPRKLNELPPAIGFMAVYRTINGCEAPMTVVEYRQGSRR